MAAYTSIANGWWDDHNIWDDGGGAPSGPPGDGDTATVNHIVAIRGNVTIGTDAGSAVVAIQISDKLKWGDPDNELGGGAVPVSGNWTLKLKGQVNIAGGGEFQVGTDTDPIPTAFIATVDIGQTHEHAIINNGTFRVHGYPSYHMDAADKQRSQLAADAAALATQIRMKDPVDWEAGDILWLATGGDKTQTPTGNEKVTILNKVDSTTYNLTAGLANNHFGGADYGDMVVHASRNVIFTGQSSVQGFSIYKSDNSGATIFDVNWCRFKYGGIGSSPQQATLGIYWVSNNDHWDLNQLTLRNLIFEDCGDASANAIVFYYAPIEPDPNFDKMDEIHIFNYKYGIYPSSLRGELRFGHVTCMEISYTGIVGAGCDSVWLKSFWFTGVVPAGINCQPLQGDASTAVKIESFKIHGAYNGVMINASKDYYSAGTFEFCNGEIFHMLGNMFNSYAINIIRSNKVGNIVIKNVDFYDIAAYAINVKYIGFMDLYNCTFNNCRYGINFPSGCVFKIRAYNCEFGTTYKNVQYNIYYIDTAIAAYADRMIFEKCKFKIPSALPAQTYDWFPEELRWVIANSKTKDWRYCATFSARFTLEFIDCQLLDAADADQWSTLYPNTDVMGIVAGRSEIHKTNATTEATGYIDGTFQRKLLPFMGLSRIHITRKRPILIPVTAGQTVTAKLSFKKNIPQVTENLPMLHLYGCGINDEVRMADVIDTWDEVTTTGVALVDGVVELWVSCWGVQDFQTIAPARGPNSDYNYAYPIDPGGISAATGVHNLILYADGLSIEKS